MQVTIHVMGLELLSLTVTTDPEPEETEHESPSGGYTTASPVGFVAAMEVPDLVPLPNRSNGWEDE